MHHLKVHWKAYPMDRSGVKTCQHGEVQLTSSYRSMNIHDVLERTRQAVWRDQPELKSCPIQLVAFHFLEEDA